VRRAAVRKMLDSVGISKCRLSPCGAFPNQLSRYREPPGADVWTVELSARIVEPPTAPQDPGALPPGSPPRASVDDDGLTRLPGRGAVPAS